MTLTRPWDVLDGSSTVGSALDAGMGEGGEGMGGSGASWGPGSLKSPASKWIIAGYAENTLSGSALGLDRTPDEGSGEVFGEGIDRANAAGKGGPAHRCPVAWSAGGSAFDGSAAACGAGSACVRYRVFFGFDGVRETSSPNS